MTQSEIREAKSEAMQSNASTFEVHEVESVEATGRGILWARGILTAGGWILLAMAAC